MNVPDPLLPHSQAVVGRDGARYSLACCPFCGDATYLLLETAADHADVIDDGVHPCYWVSCETCGTMGPVETCEAAAVALWNDRTAGLPLLPN